MKRSKFILSFIFLLLLLSCDSRSKNKESLEYSPKVLMLPSSQSIVNEVAQNKGAIGYVGLGYVDKRVKVLAISDE